MDQSEYLSGTVTKLLKELQTGDELIVQQIFDYYFQRLVNRAKSISKRKGFRLKDEEDLASVVVTAFLQDATAGEIGELRSRHDVWRMLSKRIKLRTWTEERDAAKRRKKEVGESAFRDFEGALDPQGIQQQPDRRINEIDALHRELLDELRDNKLETQIVEALLNGDTVQEIAESLGKSPNTIYLKLKRIKSRWIESNKA
jgi:hypothetical protein